MILKYCNTLESTSLRIFAADVIGLCCMKIERRDFLCGALSATVLPRRDDGALAENKATPDERDARRPSVDSGAGRAENRVAGGWGRVLCGAILRLMEGYFETLAGDI